MNDNRYERWMTADGSELEGALTRLEVAATPEPGEDEGFWILAEKLYLRQRLLLRNSGPSQDTAGEAELAQHRALFATHRTELALFPSELLSLDARYERACMVDHIECIHLMSLQERTPGQTRLLQLLVKRLWAYIQNANVDANGLAFHADLLLTLARSAHNINFGAAIAEIAYKRGPKRLTSVYLCMWCLFLLQQCEWHTAWKLSSRQLKHNGFSLHLAAIKLVSVLAPLTLRHDRDMLQKGYRLSPFMVPSLETLSRLFLAQIEKRLVTAFEDGSGLLLCAYALLCRNYYPQRLKALRAQIREFQPGLSPEFALLVVTQELLLTCQELSREDWTEVRALASQFMAENRHPEDLWSRAQLDVLSLLTAKGDA